MVVIKHDLKIIYMDVGKLKVPVWNPRKWSPKACADLRESIIRYKIVDPIIINIAPGREGYIIGGCFRYTIAKQLGYKQVPTVQLNIPELDREKNLSLRLNANTGEWDLDLLKSFDLNMLLDVGLDSKTLAPIWDDLIGTTDDTFNEAEELKKLKKPTVKLGEKYAIGKHFLVCGDSTDPEIIKFLMGEERADLVDNDLPFNLKISYRMGISGKKFYGGDVNDNKSVAEYRDFVTKMVKNSIDFSKPDAHVFNWCDENWVWLLQTVYMELGIKPQRLCLWLKNSLNPTPGVAFNKSFEVAVYGTLGRPYVSSINNLTEVMNKEITTGNNGAEAIQNIWSVKRLATNSYEHPTEKPVDLHEKALLRCTRKGDIVADFCCGSASFGVCAHQLGRRAFLCEKDPVFASLALKRMELAVGQKARKVGTYEK
ncbi:MAG: DNA modification methylase [Patescibacteria group bacterium]|nr:DNA modification methylase [Patescibacteria group bacterium]